MEEAADVMCCGSIVVGGRVGADFWRVVPGAVLALVERGEELDIIYISVDDMTKVRYVLRRCYIGKEPTPAPDAQTSRVPRSS